MDAFVEGKHRRIRRWVGLAITAAVLALAIGQMVRKANQRPAHLKEIASAFGSVNLFYGSPQPDSKGDRVAYVQTEEKCLGVFIFDTRSDQKRLVYANKNNVPLGVWPWSPDDNTFIYTCPDIVICNGETGREEARIACNASIADLAWLNSSAFVFTDNAGTLRQVQKVNGIWTQPALLNNRSSRSPVFHFSKDAIAWQDGDQIKALNLESNSVTTLFDCHTNHLKGLTFSKATGDFLFTCTEGSTSNALYRWTYGQPPERITGSSMAMIQPVHVRAESAGWAYLCDFYGKKLMVQPSRSEAPNALFAGGNVTTLVPSADGGKLFMIGICSNEISAGMWEYNVISNSLRCLVPGTDKSSPFAKRVEGLRGSLNLPSGKKFLYTLFPPANFDRHAHKKYPLLLGNSVLPNVYQGGDGRMWIPAMANCGAYVIVVERQGWWEGIDQLGTNLMTFYQHIIQVPSIDPKRVFLFGVRDESRYINEFFAQTTDLWDGLILLNPRELPQISSFNRGDTMPRIHLNYLGTKLYKEELLYYQKSAFNMGIVSDIFFHNGESEYVPDNASQRERTQAIIRFVFNTKDS